MGDYDVWCEMLIELTCIVFDDPVGHCMLFVGSGLAACVATVCVLEAIL